MSVFVSCILFIMGLILISTNDSVYAESYSISIPVGFLAQGCENTNDCYVPSLMTVEIGDIVTWANNDNVAHTITSGDPDLIKSGKIGLKKGDWVKYQVDIAGEGFLRTMINATKHFYTDPDTGCTFSDFQWSKLEVTEINDETITFKTSNFCKGKENELDTIPVVDRVSFYFIPIDAKVGDVIGDSEFTDGFRKVVGIEKRTYGSKTVDVVKVYSDSEKTLDNGYSKFTTTGYYEKSSGIMLELLFSMKIVNATLFGNNSIDLTVKAIDFNIPRLSASGSDGGCLIATATYGSELAPKVQLLREIRDNVLFSTISGTRFMTTFNTAYYSFSPMVADWERQNTAFKELVKVTITPMLLTLSILDYVKIDSEQEMLGYGIGVILLNMGIYFAAPAIIIVKLRQKFR